MNLITLPVPSHLRHPIAAARLYGPCAVDTSCATVPKAPVDKDTGENRRKHEIGFAWQVLPMEAEAKTSSVHELSDGELGRRIAAANAPHILRAPLSGEPVHDSSLQPGATES